MERLALSLFYTERVPINSSGGIQCRLALARLSAFQLRLTASLVNTIAEKRTVAETGAIAAEKTSSIFRYKQVRSRVRKFFQYIVLMINIDLEF